MRRFCLLTVVSFACGRSPAPAPLPEPGPVAEQPSAPADAAPAAPAAPTTWPALLAIADDHGCFTRGGRVLCWGDDEHGQLGTEPRRGRDAAAPVPGIDDAIGLGVLTDGACALRHGGEVICWGEDKPRRTVLRDAVRLTASWGHVCALRRGGQVACWGYSRGAAHGSPEEWAQDPTPIPGLGQVTDVAASFARTCALRTDGQVLCWGAALIDGQKSSPVPAPLPDATDVAALWGGMNLCIRRRGGEVACLERKLGDETLVAVDDWRDARQIASAASGACALLADGKVSCRGDAIAGSDWWLSLWPEGSLHTLAAPDATAVAVASRVCVLAADGLPHCRGSTERFSPRPVAGIDDAIDLAGGNHATCAMRRNREVWCWGSFNQLLSKASAPEKIEGVVDPAALGIERGLCAIDRKATMRCGYSWDGKPGKAVPAIRQVAGRGFHGCAVRTDGRIQCWGNNSDGELGDGTTKAAPEDTPVLVAGVSDAVEVAPGYEFTCARLRSGRIVCWGPGVNQQIADPGIGDAVQLVAGWNHACARRRNGKVTCWGSLPKILPDQPYDLRRIELPGIADAVDVAASPHDLCVVRAGGTVVCSGNLSIRTDADPLLLPIPDITDAAQVTLAERTLCALRRGGSIVCLGHDRDGGVGDGAAEKMTPVPLAP